MLEVYVANVNDEGRIVSSVVDTGNALHLILMVNGRELRISEEHGVIHLNSSTGQLVIVPQAANDVKIGIRDWSHSVA